MSACIRHAKADLALHSLRKGEGSNLLLLHGLGERSPESLPKQFAAWPGRIFALDFTGHGESTLPRGGGYSAELLMGDADAAIAELGAATVCGRGLGAYIALLLAGARPKEVCGAILCDGPGLSGGGSQPTSPMILQINPADESAGRTPDPFALAELAHDLRPPDYATSFVHQCTHLSGLERPISVSARERPEWLRAVLEEPGVAETSLEEALAFYAQSG